MGGTSGGQFALRVRQLALHRGGARGGRLHLCLQLHQLRMHGGVAGSAIRQTITASCHHCLEPACLQGCPADAYEKALRKNPGQHAIRARRAGLLLQLGRSGQAAAEIIKVFSSEGVDEGSIGLALQVGEDLCNMYEGQYRDDEVERIVEFAADHVERSATLLAHRARVAAQQGDAASAKRDLKKARRLDPELEIYERVERAMKPARSSWWRW